MPARPLRLVSRLFAAVLATALTALPAAAQQAEDASALTPSFQEGDIITLDSIDKLKPYLPAEFWDNRDFFFFEGMQLEIGPTQFDYAPAKEFAAATEKYRGM